MSTYKWNAAVNGSWNNPTLWDAGHAPVVGSGSDSYVDYSADTAVFNTGSTTAYGITGTAHALTLNIVHDTVLFDGFAFSNDGGYGHDTPTLSVTDGANVTFGPNSRVYLYDTVAYPYGSFGRIIVNNAALTVQGSLTGLLDIQNKGVITATAGSALVSPLTNHSPQAQAVIEAGGILNAGSGVNVNTPFWTMAGTVNLDNAKGQSGNITATGVINGSNGATLNGQYYQWLANTQNAGTITATAGFFTITGSIAGTGQLLINPNATLVLDNADSNNITFVGDNATLELVPTANITGLLQGFGRGDAVDLDKSLVTNLTATDKNGITTVTAYNGGTRVNSFNLAGDYSLRDFNFTSDAKGGSLISYVDHTPASPVTPTTPDAPSTTPKTPPASFLITDTTTGTSSSTSGEAYTGPVADVAVDYITITPDNLAISAVTPNVFIHTGNGQDAIRALSGRNVLDGGTGSNFLTAGTGTDTFFVDARNAPSDTWSTVVGAKTGDDVTVFGITPDTFAISWVDGQGATGSLGLTMHASSPSHPQASFTLAGFSTADLASGKVSAAFGANGSEPYLNLHVN